MNNIDFDKEYRNIKPDLLRFLKHKYSYNDHLEDLINDAFISAYQYIEQYNSDKGTFRNWIWNITINKVKMEYKLDRLNPFSLDREISDEYHLTFKDIISDIDEIEYHELINQKAKITIDAIYLLPEKYKKVMILRELENKSYKEIANILNITLSSAKNQVRKGRILINKKTKKQFKMLNEI